MQAKLLSFIKHQKGLKKQTFHVFLTTTIDKVIPRGNTLIFPALRRKTRAFSSSALDCFLYPAQPSRQKKR